MKGQSLPASLATLCLVTISLRAPAQLERPLSFRTVALTGQPAPGVPGQTFTGFGTPHVSWASNNLFTAELSGSPGSANDALILDEFVAGFPARMELRTVARVGQPAVGIPGETFTGFTYSTFGGEPEQPGFIATTSGPSGAGLWTQTRDVLGQPQLNLLARRGAAPPGVSDGSTFASFSSFKRFPYPFDSAFRAELANAPAGKSIGLWRGSTTALRLVARTADPAPGVPGATLAALDDFFVNGFLATLSTSTPQSSDQGIWTDEIPGNPQLVLRSGQPAPQAGGALFDTFSLGSGGNLNFFQATLRGPGVQPSNDRAFFGQGFTAPLTLLARTGAQASSMPAGVTFAQLGDPVGAIDQYTHLAKLAGPGISDANDDVVWLTTNAWHPSRADRVVVREGQPAPGAQDGATFEAFEDPTVGFSDVRLVFAATLDGPSVTPDNDRGIWGYTLDRPHSLYLIAREGDPFQVAPGDVRTIEELHVLDSQTPHTGEPAWNAPAGLVPFRADFTDGSSGIFVATLPNIPEPACLILLCAAFPLLFHRRRPTHRAY